MGKIISIKDNNNIEITSNTHIANINPFRYRSYYYDFETKLYYLNSRYYNPEWGRFINADGIIGANEDILSYNLYIYVSNNPVNNIDIEGNLALTMFATALIATVAVATAVVAGKAIGNALSGTSLAFPTKKQLEVPDLTKTKSKAEVKVKTKSKVTSKVAAVSKAKEDVTKKDITKPCTPAKISKSGDVIRLNPRMDIKTTVTTVKSGASVMCDDQASALAVARGTGLGYFYHSPHKNNIGYYPHYHPNWPNQRTHPHIWYYY